MGPSYRYTCRSFTQARKRSLCSVPGRIVSAVSIILVTVSPSFAQTSSLSLTSGSTIVGGSVDLGLVLNAPAGNSPAALQWTLTYSAAAVTGFSFVADPALTSAGKSLQCAGAAGSYTCLVS